MIRAITIDGDFDDDDFRLIVDVVRMIEKQHPDRNYRIVGGDTERSMAQVRELIDEIFQRPAAS